MEYNLTDAQRQRVEQLRRMTPAEWDAICKRCGICCLMKVGVCLPDQRTVYLNRCCDKLDTRTRCCTMYKARLGRSNCEKVDIDIVLAGGLLPASCGYVEYVFGPAQFPARVDFNQIRPITDRELENMSDAEMCRDAIGESILWNRCCR